MEDLTSIRDTSKLDERLHLTGISLANIPRNQSYHDQASEDLCCLHSHEDLLVHPNILVRLIKLSPVHDPGKWLVFRYRHTKKLAQRLPAFLDVEFEQIVLG